MECYSATKKDEVFCYKKDEVLAFAATWMDLREVMLSEISQSGKDK